MAEHPLWLEKFINVYQKLSSNNLALLVNVYHQNVTFIDPIHQVEGFDNLYQYFKGLYQNLASCEFEIEHVIMQESHAAIYWTMSYRHAKLNKGKTVVISGNSHLKGRGDKVIYHRDYLDLGAMFYEQLPVLGKLIRWIKLQAIK